MNKNTILAIVLSTIVVIVSIVLQSRFMPKVVASEGVSTDSTATSEVATDGDGGSTASTTTDAAIAKEMALDAGVVSASLNEQKITIHTDKADVVLTNRGGDIVSFILNKDEHLDTDTGDGIQMVDNVSAVNRACSVGFGNEKADVINELFDVTQSDGENGEKIVFFKRRWAMTNDDGEKHTWTLGKKYTFLPNEYMFRLEILLHGDDENAKLNKNNASYSLRTPPQIGPHYDAKLNRYEYRQFISYNGKKAKRQNVAARQFKMYNKEYLWNGIAGKYFVALAIPEAPHNMKLSYYSTLIEANDYANAQAIMVRKPLDTQDAKDVYYMYYGPRNEKNLKIYNASQNNGFGLSMLNLTNCMQSSGWLGWLETILKWIMEIINKFAHNWGVSIILMTILIKLLMFPMTKKQSMSTLKMQEIQPKVLAIQEKYKDNPQKQQEALANMYKEVGYNPMSGCLPMIFQFLILFAMYNLFNNYFEFRGKGFIPGWISDLTVGDSVYNFGKNIPFFGSDLRILPIIYLISQLLFGKITGNGGTVSAGSSKMQMNLMMYGMPIIFFFLFYNAPSGLLLYWTVSNIFQMVQQVIINKTLNKKKAEMAGKVQVKGKGKR